MWIYAGLYVLSAILTMFLTLPPESLEVKPTADAKAAVEAA